MKKFLLRLGCFLAIQVALLVFVMNYGSRDSYSNDYMYSLKDKYDLLKETPGRRMIFVGGSNLAFGLKSDEIKKNLGYNPINMGLHGDLGLPILLRMVKEQVRKDDIVIISPEFSILFCRSKCSEKRAIELANAWPGSRRFLRPDFGESLDELAPPLDPMREIAYRVAISVKRLKGTERRNKLSYRRNSFNEFGDHTAHYTLTPDREPNNGLYRISEGIFPVVASDLRDFHQHCREQKAKVYFIHPPVRETNGRKCSAELDRMDRMISEQIEFPILTQWRDTVLKDSMFFDSKFHLNLEGAKARTQVICQKLTQLERVASHQSEMLISR